jgi:penicillin-binding protein 2
MPWRERDHALFVAYAPIDAPRYAMAVVVEHGGGGSAVAAPIAHDILLACQKRMRERPGERIAKNEPRRGDAGG